jgi:ABC-type sugar transport system ATPase subunit
MNLVPAPVVDGRATLAGQPVMAVPRGHDEVVLGIRPESLRIGGSNGVPVTVDFHEPLGSHVLVHTVLGGPPSDAVDESAPTLILQAPPDVRPMPGEQLRLTAEPESLYVFDAATGAAIVETTESRVSAG